jgi:DNA-binding FrmR family transcriptional regulator
LEGVERMINDHRYCPDIITQLRAARAALKSIEASVLETHFGHCVSDAAKAGTQEERSRKIKEIMDLFVKS